MFQEHPKRKLYSQPEREIGNPSTLFSLYYTHKLHFNQSTLHKTTTIVELLLIEFETDFREPAANHKEKWQEFNQLPLCQKEIKQ